MSYVALIGCVVYTIGCYLWGAHFPFYKFKLYAGAGDRTKGAVPVFFCEGKEADIWKYEHFSQIDPEQFLAHRMPTSVTWMVEEAAQWVRDNQLQNREQGPLNVSFGFRVLSVNDDGSINETIHILERGFAWKR